MLSRLPALLVTAALGLAVAGCGDDGGDEATETSAPSATTSAQRGYDSPVPVVTAYVEAFGAGDYAAACRHIAAETLERVTSGGEHRCEDIYAQGGEEVDAARERFEGAETTDAQVNGDAGTVGVRTAAGEELRLPVVLEDGTWKVAS
jgi:hypothetical protein